MTSLNRRLLTSVLLLLLVFFGLTIFALDFLFRDLSERSLRDSLDAQLVALIAASEPNARGDLVPAGALAEARLRQPGSGIYAEIRTRQGDTLWRSQSSLGTEIDFGSGVAPGARRYERRRLPDGSRLMVLASGLSWEIRPGTSRDFVFSVATDLRRLRGAAAALPRSAARLVPGAGHSSAHRTRGPAALGARAGASHRGGNPRDRVRIAAVARRCNCRVS